ncbi:MAG: hypothetical protein RLZZ490_1422 [Cyanobacteriota bacterium]|jgi:hypothetical protein
MDITEEYLDVFQGLERPIVAYYRQHSQLIDAEVVTAITWLIRVYNAEVREKTAPLHLPNGMAGDVVQAVQPVCEWYLGRGQKPPTSSSKNGWVQKLFSFSKSETQPRIITTSELLNCLRRIQSSIKFWTKQRGRQGYLNYVSSFIP